MLTSFSRSQSFIKDVLKCDKGFIMEIEVPGVRKEDLSLKCAEGCIEVEAKKVAPKYPGYERVVEEREFETFKGIYKLPADINCEGIEASLDNGVLTVKLPRTVIPKINIKVN